MADARNESSSVCQEVETAWTGAAQRQPCQQVAMHTLVDHKGSFNSMTEETKELYCSIRIQDLLLLCL